MQEEYYLNKLYPFQDEIFKILNNLETDFYLTGGTALSRFYLEHRYSDDLDLFVNNSRTFAKDSELVISKISFIAKIEIVQKSVDFIRLNVLKGNINLKIDLVNDVEYRSGKNQSFEIMNKVDNLDNILSNKLTALERLEPKDIADILYLWRNRKINWGKAFDDASKKVSYINPLDVSLLINAFPRDCLTSINWINLQDFDKAAEDLEKISKEILLENYQGPI